MTNRHIRRMAALSLLTKAGYKVRPINISDLDCMSIAIILANRLSCYTMRHPDREIHTAIEALRRASRGMQYVPAAQVAAVGRGGFLSEDADKSIVVHGDLVAAGVEMGREDGSDSGDGG